MTRYKGRISTKAIEQAYPHIVQMIVPLGGFGKKLDEMYEWHRARVCVPRTSSALISRKNRLTSAHHDYAAVFRAGRLGRAIQVEEPA